MPTLESIGKGSASLLSITALFIGTIGFLDNRHAKSSDFEALRAESYEAKLLEIQDAILMIEVVRVNKLTVDEQLQLKLSQLRNRQELYIRKLEDKK